jgi:bifunctional non-homologous end joining protein LigD
VGRASPAGAAGPAAALRALDAALTDGRDAVVLSVGGIDVPLTNLGKRYFPGGGPGATTKGDLLRYYLSAAPVILPHLAERPVVLTRYPNGAGTKGFYVQRAPESRPVWVRSCPTCVKPPKEVEYLTIDSAAALLWVANLGAIELHPWYSRCSGATTPDFLVIDLDPVGGTSFTKVRDAALHVRDALDSWGLPAFVKTSGVTGLHVFVPIERGPSQQAVHDVARDLASVIAGRHPTLFTLEYRIANRPRRRVLLDHNQNALGHHLAGAYSVRPTPTATVSTPIDWGELAAGASPSDFTIASVPALLRKRRDPWETRTMQRARVDLGQWRDRMLTSHRGRASA